MKGFKDKNNKRVVQSTLVFLVRLNNYKDFTKIASIIPLLLKQISDRFLSLFLVCTLKKIGTFSDLIFASLRVSWSPQKCPFTSWFIQIRIQTCRVFSILNYVRQYIFLTWLLVCPAKRYFVSPASAERECCDLVHFDVYFVVMFLGSFRAPHWTEHITALKNKNKSSSALVLNAFPWS